MPLDEGGVKEGKKKVTLLEKPFKGIINDIKRKVRILTTLRCEVDWLLVHAYHDSVSQVTAPHSPVM